MTQITEDEIFAALDKIRQAPERGLTLLQFKVIHSARTVEPKIAWNKLTKFFNTTFDTRYSVKQICNKYFMYMRSRNG